MEKDDIVLSAAGWVTKSVTATEGNFTNVAPLGSIIDLIYWGNAYARYICDTNGVLKQAFDSVGNFNSYLEVGTSSDAIFIRSKGYALTVSCKIIK